jgi:hypothetical protein
MRVLVPCWLFLATLAAPARVRTDELQADSSIEFNRDIRPILSDVCYTCHGPDAANRKAALRLDTQAGAFGQRDSGRPLAPGSLVESQLWQRINAADPARRMPPPESGRQLTAQQIELLGRWLEQGAPWQQHWSFIAPQRPALPRVRHAAWLRNPIDHFVLARLEREGIEPSPEASRETLIRRVTLDLTGLPPTLKEIDAFLADQSPDAYEKVVDRLLQSPHYGERMVLEWLDAARYSDTNGYQTDGTRAMWPWRDWVIDALNRNMPFDEFTIEQIAGDMLPDATLQQRIASGFHRNHMLNGEGGRIPEESRVEYVVDRVDTTATVWLGLTLGCARCHDHKYDPISQREFYGLYAFFNNVAETGAVDRRNSTAAPTLELPTDEQKARIAEQEQAVARVEGQLRELTDKLLAAQPEWEKTVPRDTLPAKIQQLLQIEPEKRGAEQAKELREHYLAGVPERQPLQKQVDEARKRLGDLRNGVLITMIMEERPEPRETFLLVRGQYDKYGERLVAGMPAIFPPLPAGAPSNRLGFAQWLVDPSNPLTARVTVNRYWQNLFGTGLVKTAEDFGSQGEPPSHPELLDWLAAEFSSPAFAVEPPTSRGPQSPGWNVKAAHRLIVTSATYRQSSRATPALLERDPQNRLLARGPRFRLSSHLLRDQALAASGLLVAKLGGPPVRPYQPPGIWEDFSLGKIQYEHDHGENLYRRSLYTFWRRSVAPPAMFDSDGRQVCTVRRPRTNTPLQALTLLNDVTFVEAARVLAEHVMKVPARTHEHRLRLAFRIVTGRVPTAAETAVLLEARQRLHEQYARDVAAAWELVSAGEAPRDTSLDGIEHAAYTGIANLLFNLDEVLNKE